MSASTVHFTFDGKQSKIFIDGVDWTPKLHSVTIEANATQSTPHVVLRLANPKIVGTMDSVTLKWVTSDG